MESKSIRSFFPVIVFFVVTMLALALIPGLENLWGMSRTVMIAGNLVLFAVTVISFYFYSKALLNDNVHAFMRMIYGGMFIKMMICLFTALIYIMVMKKGVSKGAIFGCMFLYFVYTFMEISIIMKLSRKDKYVKE